MFLGAFKYKNMRLFFTTIVLLVITSGYSQSSGVVQYKLIVPMDIENSNNNEIIKKKVLKTIEYANNLEFKLTFNKMQSKFEYIDILNFENEDEKNANYLARLIYAPEDIYVDFERKLHINKRMDGTLIENKVDPYNWEIASESKMIDAFLCYKAVLKIPFVNSRGENKIEEIICWFTPSLPYSFGPKNYYGLPGLILEFTQNDRTFLASKIELSEKNIKIDFPKGRGVTQDEYNKRSQSSQGAVLLSKKKEEANEKSKN